MRNPLLQFFRRKKGRGKGKHLTLAEVVDMLKKEGYPEEAIRGQLLRSFGKKQLKSFGEGVTIPPEKVDSILHDIQSETEHD